jgi:hypothetical protein
MENIFKKIICILLWFICINNIFSLSLNNSGNAENIILLGNIVLKNNYGPPNYGDDPENDIIENNYYIGQANNNGNK